MSFTFDFTKQQLQSIIGNNSHIDDWYDAICKILPEYNINTPERVAAWVAQCAHESANFTVLKENLNYRASSLRRVFPKYFPTDMLAEDYVSRPNKQEAIANRVYANRMGNGNEASGDGARFIGRGLIQLTGRNNYTLFSEYLNMSLDEVIDYSQTFEGAVQSACWFWDQNHLNRWADAGDILTLTKRINGGINGLDDRKKHYYHALEVLGGDFSNPAPVEILQRGSKGPRVRELQRALGITDDGDFGPATERTLKSWQSVNGLVADGIAGPITLRKLLG